MAISVVARNKGVDASFSGSASAAFASNTGGNAIIVVGVIDASAGVMATPTDTAGNAYALLETLDNGWSMKVKLWIKYNCAASGGANTVSMGDGFNAAGLFIFEVSGLAASAAYDKFAAQQQASVTSLDSTSTATTSFANELLIGITGNSAATSNLPTVGSGYSNLQTWATGFASAGSEEQIVAATGAYNATFGVASNTDNHTTAIFTFSDTAIVNYIPKAHPYKVNQAINRAGTF